MFFSSMFDDSVGLHILKMLVLLTLLLCSVLSLSWSAVPAPEGLGSEGSCVPMGICMPVHREAGEDLNSWYVVKRKSQV